MNAPCLRSRGWGGFSLVELLTVLAIIAILSAIAIPSLIGISSNYNLNRGTSQVTDEFNFARQTALTRNSDVELRIYQVGTATAPSDVQFRGFRCLLSSTGESLDKASFLPDPVILSPNVAFSTLFDYTNVARSGLTHGTETLPVKGTVAYISFLFRATGGTGLMPVTPPVGIWDLTLLMENAAVIPATGLPANYVTIQIEPVEGQVRVYRP